MTISSTTRKTGIFTGNGVTVNLPFAFKVFDETDIAVIRADSTGAETTLTLTTDYSVTLNADQDGSPGGTVTLVAPLATGYTAVVTSNIGMLQAVKLTNQGGFFPAVLNNALDKLTIFAQQLSEKVDRSIKASITSGLSPDALLASIEASESNAAASATSAASSATAAAASYDAFDDRYLGAKAVEPTLDNDGNALVTGALYWDTAVNKLRVYGGAVWVDVDISGVTAFARTLLDDADAATALSTLGVSSFIQTLLNDADAATARATLAVRSSDDSKSIKTISASVAGNALTVGLDPTVIDFRSATLTSGSVNTRTVASALSLTISSGSTLGTVDGTAARLAVLAIDNAGTVELAVVNLAGGNNLDETNLISTTAEGGAGGADSNNVIYSATARTNVPFRVVGFVGITEATAGTWATAPTLVQGVGGQALAAMASLGQGQQWTDVTASRAAGTTYYNTTGKPTAVNIKSGGAANSTISITATVGGVTFVIAQANSSATAYAAGGFIVPPGVAYSVAINLGGIAGWHELR